MAPWQYQLFTIGFIVLFQNTLLLLISLPAWVVYSQPTMALTPAHAALVVVFLALLALETAADQQQWNFHQAKAAAKTQGRQPEHRFLTTGLFRFSRHPNFFAEQSQWWVFWAFGALSLGGLWHWSLVGPVLLSLLFIGSTRFTESLTLEKYPEYRDYQARTSPMIPWLPGHPPASTARA